MSLGGAYSSQMRLAVLLLCACFVFSGVLAAAEDDSGELAGA